MKLELTASKQTWASTEQVTVRLVAINDSYDPATLDRRLLIGPNPVPQNPRGMPMPVSVEPSLADEGQNVLILNPMCIYGRERTFPNLPAGSVTFHAYLLSRSVGGLPPQGPTDSDALAASAEPLVLTIQ